MNLIFLKIDQSPISDLYMDQLLKRAANPNMAINPFYIKVKQYSNLYAVSIKPIYPNFSWIGLLVSGVSFFFWRFNWSFFLGLFVMVFGVLWTNKFYFYVIRLGLRKKGYKGKIELVPTNAALEVLLWDKEKF